MKVTNPDPFTGEDTVNVIGDPKEPSLADLRAKLGYRDSMGRDEACCKCVHFVGKGPGKRPSCKLLGSIKTWGLCDKFRRLCV